MMQNISKDTHLSYLKQTITLARQSPPKPTNFCVGCVIVSYTDPTNPKILSTGYTLELPGNTHAEQCAISKLQSREGLAEDNFSGLFQRSDQVILYTSMEPCGLRLSGGKPCVERVIATRDGSSGQIGISKVVFGAKEPGTFVKDSKSCQKMDDAGIDWEYIPDLEPEILAVAKSGHAQASTAGDSSLPARGPDQPTHRLKRTMDTSME